MKVAVTSMGETIDSPIDPRFGRARYFIIYDTETDEWSVHNNEQNLNAVQGAGIQAAETIVRLEAGTVVSGNVGPKAFRVLSAAGIKIYLSGKSTVADAVHGFKAGELQEISEASVEGHWA